MANVYLALARGPIGFTKLCVLKVLRRALEDEAEAVKMFVNEAQLAARLNHANVVQTYEVLEDGGRHVMVMEYLEGQSLFEILTLTEGERRDRKLPLAMHLQILSSTLAGLHHAHELADFDGRPLGIVHRDVSPHNVFVCFDGAVKVLDFGIAKALAVGTSATRTGVIKGKVRYMAPEQMAGEKVDRRADVFGVGALLWEAIAGGQIWKGMVDGAVMNAVSRGEIPAPRLGSPDVPKGLASICAKAMSIDREQRFATAAEMEAELDEELRRMGAQVKPRELGGWVAERFAESRLRTKALIEEGLKGEHSLGMKDLALAAPEPPRTGETQTSAVLAADGRSRRRRAGLLTVPLLALGSLVAVMTVLRTRGTTPSPAGAAAVTSPAAAPPLAAPAASSSATPSSAPTWVIVRIEATPAAARLFVDDRPLRENPTTQLFAPDGQRHRLRAEAPGFAASETSVVFDRNENVVLNLSRASGPAPKHPPAPGSAAPSPSHSPGSDCSNPYAVDERGIKTVKPECM
jgi:serine/threonine-protein kinase